jgi:phosphatidylglycerophosphate synthase
MMLVRRGVSADALTLATVPVGLVASACLLLSPATPILLLAVPLLAAGRLVLNLLDGAVARRSGRTHELGEFYNEVGDRLTDIAFLAPVAFLPGADRTTVLLGVTAAVLASFIGLAARAAGGERIYRGVLSKPGRMALLSGFALATLVAGQGAWALFGPLLLIGALLTVVERVILAVRRLA